MTGHPGVIVTLDGEVHSPGAPLLFADDLAAVRGDGVFETLLVRDGRAWQQGNWITALLWIIGLAAHLGYDALVYKSSALGNVTILLYLAVSLAVQRVILQTRADRLPVEAGAGL